MSTKSLKDKTLLVITPGFPDEVIINASLNVIKAYELITAQKFKLAETYASDDRLMSNLKIFNQK